ncbi:hypothetical protein T10_8559 [Trichinella papuae]|uniref:Uncharacterized protein n=1 Tax=Trichinella papuae TaxID=268474 RepID=A0A0V1N4I6_9BILA|nr:hypothetical protein T10_8559 [Trichinella papuae]
MKERLLPVGQDDAHSPDDRLFVAHLLPNCRRFDADHPVRNDHERDPDAVSLNFRSRINTLHMPVGKRKPQDGLTVSKRGRLVLILNDTVSAVGLLMHSCEILPNLSSNNSSNTIKMKKKQHYTVRVMKISVGTVEELFGLDRVRRSPVQAILRVVWRSVLCRSAVVVGVLQLIPQLHSKSNAA